SHEAVIGGDLQILAVYDPSLRVSAIRISKDRRVPHTDPNNRILLRHLPGCRPCLSAAGGALIDLVLLDAEEASADLGTGHDRDQEQGETGEGQAEPHALAAA